MDFTEQLQKVEAAKQLDLTEVHDKIVKIVTTTNEKVAKLREAANIKRKNGYGNNEELNLANKLQTSATDDVRALVFGTYLNLVGKPVTAQAVLFFGTEDWEG